MLHGCPWSAKDLGDEFQFMYDQIARNILSAFGVSPDELPGYGHLSKGTNSQTLSESNNEFKFTASTRFWITSFDPEVPKLLQSTIVPDYRSFIGQNVHNQVVWLDAQSKEQETTRLQQDMVVSMNMDEVLHEVDKEPIGKVLGGKIPFNERYQLLADKYKNVSDLMGPFFGSPGAVVDPLLKYKRDPFFLQWLQLLAQVNPAAVQAYFAPRPYAMEFLKMQIEDELEGEDNI